MKAEYLTQPECLRGRSIIEIVSLLPTFPWFIEVGGRRIDAKIRGFTIVDYDTWKPRKEIDLYGEIPVTPGIPIEMGRLARELQSKQGRSTALASIVWLDKEEWSEGAYPGVEEQWVHFPTIDIDLDNSELPQQEILGWIKREIKEKTEIAKGAILLSGDSGHYHFVGTERLLTEDQFITFVGLCLTMKDPEGKPLVDTKWVGHSLTPMKYLVEDAKKGGEEWSVYDFISRFASIRVTTSEKKLALPTVVDVM